MDSEFPDPGDEFDLMHEDEYEILRELEASETPSRFVNNTSTQKAQIDDQRSNTTTNTQKSNGFSQNENEILQVTAVIENEPSIRKTSNEAAKKRTFTDVLNDISIEEFDAINVDDFNYDLHEKKKPCWDRPEELMKLILDRRKNFHSGGQTNNIYENHTPINKQKNFITKRVPTWNFVAVTRTEDGERFYIKVTEKSQYVPKTYRPAPGSLIKSFSKLKDEAEEIIVRNVKKASIMPLENGDTQNLSCELWVDKYRPKRYLELLSDENVNKSLLYWLRLWDKIVFDRDTVVRPKKPQISSKFKNKFKNKEEEVPDHDSKGFPTHRIALITGPPGLGKTTLANVAARHAGYNIVEINASDDRGPEAFREALLASTQMKSLIDKDKRPNCLILDEIDGAPAASIDLLLKFIHGKLAPKGRNAKEKLNKENHGCRRPIICICNDLYTPSLRPLRLMALVINVPEITPASLAERLASIAKREGVHVDSRLLIQLAERSHCDVRACLGILQYTAGKADMLQSLTFGLKDMRKGLFDSWRAMFQIPMTRKGTLTNSERALKIVRIVYQGESDRLAQGIFHNYPEVCKDKLNPVDKSLQWFEFYDEVNTLVMERQSWILMPYTTSAFVAWHLYLAGVQNPKISFPTATAENNQKLERNKAILSVTKKVAKIDILTLVCEVLPYLPDLLSPKLRSVNIQLYSPNEKLELERLINLMLDFGLSFSQEKRPEGGYEYYLDPNIWDIGVFPDCKPRKPLQYAVKQIIIQELETARLQRAAIQSGDPLPSNSTAAAAASSSATNKKKEVELPLSQSSSSSQENVPNHMKQLTPLEVKPEAEKKCRNFFAAFQKLGSEKHKKQLKEEKAQGIVNPAEQRKEEAKEDLKKQKNLLKSDVWYQYQEGYSNAIRRTVRMRDLL